MIPTLLCDFPDRGRWFPRTKTRRYDARGITFDVKRGDESAEIGMITDHVIAEILESDLIVADLSFLNGNVFYELGIAHAKGKPVIHIAHRGRSGHSITSAIAP